jgi:hypothetical protein
MEILLSGTVDPSSGTARAAAFFTHRSDLNMVNASQSFHGRVGDGAQSEPWVTGPGHLSQTPHLQLLVRQSTCTSRICCDNMWANRSHAAYLSSYDVETYRALNTPVDAPLTQHLSTGNANPRSSETPMHPSSQWQLTSPDKLNSRALAYLWQFKPLAS